jgi:hypothetical protein
MPGPGLVPGSSSNESLFVIAFVLRSAEFFGQPDKKPFGPPDVAEPIRVFVPDYFAYEFRAALAKPFQRLVNVIHGEHDAEIAQSVHRSVAVIRDDRRREEAGKLETAVPVRRAHHRNLDALIAQSGDTSSPCSLNRGPPFELQAELSKEINGPSEVIDDNSYVVHPLQRHVPNLQEVDSLPTSRLISYCPQACLGRHLSEMMDRIAKNQKT